MEQEEERRVPREVWNPGPVSTEPFAEFVGSQMQYLPRTVNGRSIPCEYGANTLFSL
jgi:hypothetical protein